MRFVLRRNALAAASGIGGSRGILCGWGVIRARFWKSSDVGKFSLPALGIVLLIGSTIGSKTSQVKLDIRRKLCYNSITLREAVRNATFRSLTVNLFRGLIRMNTNAIPALTPESVGALSDSQLITWYSKHPNATVRALIQRLAYTLDKHTGERLNSYQEGFASAQDHFTKPNPHGLTPDELRLGAVYSMSLDD
jgi:hypothetical protein